MTPFRKRTLIAAALVFGGISLTWLYRDYRQSQTSAAARVWPASPALEKISTPASSNSSRSSGSGNTIPSRSRPQPGSSTTSGPVDNAERIATEGDFQRLIETANLTTTLTIAKAVQLLRAEDQTRIAELFRKTLRDMAQSDNDKRERLVYIANELQSDELLPFWQDIAMRRPARFDNEAKYLEYGEPTEELHSIHLELMNSIRNLGLIGARNAEASRFLQDLILRPTSPFHDDFIRERAFISLKEADLSAGIRVLKSLKPKDTLRERLLRP